MNILAFYPGFDPTVNDMVSAVAFLAQQGHQIRVVTARTNRSKSRSDAPVYECHAGIHIHRPYTRFHPDMIYRPRPVLQKLRDVLVQFKPDVLLCSQEGNTNIGLAAKQLLGSDIPIVVVSEFAGRLAQHGYEGILANLTLPLIGIPRGKRYWPWLCRNAQAIITCYHGDAGRLGELSDPGTPVHYVPWCNELPQNLQLPNSKQRDMAVYMGAFSRWKNTDAFLEIVPAIFDNTPTQRLVLVGSGRTEAVTTLKKKFGNRIDHHLGMLRTEALELLASAYYGITPVRSGGWGFIGDCWAVKTPLVAMFNDYALNHQRDAIVGGDLLGVVAGINALYQQPDLYRALQETGYERYQQQHTAAAVGAAYETILTQTVSMSGSRSAARSSTC